MSWQPLLIQRIKALGYIADEKGVCFGLAHMAMQAGLLGELPAFAERLKKFYEIPVNDLASLDASQIADYRALSEGIILYQTPYIYEELFEAGSSPKKQHDSALMEPLIRSKALEEQGGIAEIVSFTGIYNLEELTSYFKLLRETSMGPPEMQHPLSFILESYGHAINVNFNPANKNNPWVLTDANQFPISQYQDDRAIAQAVMKALFSSNVIAFSTGIYSTKKYSAEQQKFVDNWKNNEKWQEIHKVAEKSRLVDDSKVSWFDIAVRHGDLESLNQLLQEPHINPEKTLLREATPFFSAVERSNLEIIVRLLQDPRVDPNARNAQGKTPLLIAGEVNNQDIIDTLLASVRVNPKLIDTNSHQYPFHLAARFGYIKLLKALLDRKDIDPNEPDRYGQTPLYLAIHNNQLEIVKALLAYSSEQLADVGNTLLSRASQLESSEILEVLLSARKDMDANFTDSSNITPLLSASMKGAINGVKLLLSRPEIDPNKEHSNGMTPLTIAAYKGFTEIAKALIIRNDVDINKGPNGASPLCFAAHYGQVEIIKLLLTRKDIDFNRTYEGKSALKIAEDNGNLEMVNLIQEAINSKRLNVSTNPFSLFASPSSSVDLPDANKPGDPIPPKIS